MFAQYWCNTGGAGEVLQDDCHDDDDDCRFKPTTTTHLQLCGRRNIDYLVGWTEREDGANAASILIAALEGNPNPVFGPLFEDSESG